MRAWHALVVVAAVLAALAAIEIARERAVPLRARIRLVVVAALLAAALLTR